MILTFPTTVKIIARRTASLSYHSPPPPIYSHKLQPLDKSVYGPLKKYVNTVCDSWMLNSPGKTMTIYDIPVVLRDFLPLATNPRNIIDGFKGTGIPTGTHRTQTFFRRVISFPLTSQTGQIPISLQLHQQGKPSGRLKWNIPINQLKTC